MLTFIFLSALFFVFYTAALVALINNHRYNTRKIISRIVEWFFTVLVTAVIIYCICWLYYGPREFFNQPLPF